MPKRPPVFYQDGDRRRPWGLGSLVRARFFDRADDGVVVEREVEAYVGRIYADDNPEGWLVQLGGGPLDRWLKPIPPLRPSSCERVG